MSTYEELLRLNPKLESPIELGQRGIILAICALADELRSYRLLKEEQDRQYAEEDAAMREQEDRRMEITSKQIPEFLEKAEKLMAFPFASSPKKMS